MSEQKPSPGPALIASLRDFVQTLKRGERIGAHYKVREYIPCPLCGDPVLKPTKEPPACGSCGWQGATP